MKEVSPDKTNFIVDAETLSNLILFCFVDYWNDERCHFLLWKDHNDLDKLFKFLDRNIELQERHVTFNGLAFDSQIIHWMLENRDHLEYLPTVSAINEIYQYAQKCIQRTFGNEFHDYPEWRMVIPQLDLFKMLHFDNPSKMLSLKWISCSIDWSSIEDMPYEHTHYIETQDEVNEIISYCYNDCNVTKKILHLCREEVDIRAELSREYGVNLYSASEPRMAKELFLYFLSRDLSIERKELKKWSTLREQIEVGKILLPYIKFERQEFQMLFNNFKKLVIGKIGQPLELKKAFAYNVTYRGLSIDYGVGGIHGFSTPGKYYSDAEYVIMSSDAKSYYPNLGIENEWAPAHIPKKAFCHRYKSFYLDRGKFPKGSPKNYVYKILLNSSFGLSIDKHSMLSDPEYGVKTTINGQLLLSMLMEMLCEGIPEAQPIMQNTDGHEIRIPQAKEKDYLDICKKWEILTKLELEHDKYKSLFAFDCNNYISVYENGKFKCKGRFEFEAHDLYKVNVLHKNKSFLVVAKGVFEYFVNGIAPDDFVRAHRRIYDFCGYARAKGQWKFYQISSSSAGVEDKPIQKTLRYFMSVNGSKVLKRHPDGREQQIVAGRNHLMVFNKFYECPWDDYNIDYQFYVKEIRKEIKLLEKEQLQLF